MSEYTSRMHANRIAQAKHIEIPNTRKDKAKTKAEITEKACEICGKLSTKNHACKKCRKTLCDNCVRTDAVNMYCPVCFDSLRSISKLA